MITGPSPDTANKRYISASPGNWNTGYVRVHSVDDDAMLCDLYQ